MTVNNDTSLVGPTQGDGTTKIYSFNKRLDNNSDLVVVWRLRATPFTETTKSENSDYVISGSGPPYLSGVTVTFTTAPPVTVDVLMERVSTISQPTPIGSQVQLPASSIETGLDHCFLVLQEFFDKISRTVQRSIFTNAGFSLTLPSQIDQAASAGLALVVNSTYNGFGLSTYNPDAQVTAATAQAVAAVASANTASASASAASVSAAAALVSANAASASAVAAAASAVSAAASVPAVATVAETLTGTNNAKIVTAADLAAIWSQGTDIVSAGTLLIPATGGAYFNVTGTTGITAINQAAALKTGRRVMLKFAGILTFTHNATSLILPGAANITTVAGDTAELICEDAANNYWRCVQYTRADGSPTALPAGTSGFVLTGNGAGTPATFQVIPTASQAQMEAASSNAVYVPPGMLQYHPGNVKTNGFVKISAGTPTLQALSYNVASITDIGVGNTKINLTTSYSAADAFSAWCCPQVNTAAYTSHIISRLVGSFNCQTLNTSGTSTDADFAFGSCGDYA